LADYSTLPNGCKETACATPDRHRRGRSNRAPSGITYPAMPKRSTVSLVCALIVCLVSSIPAFALPDARLLRIAAEGDDFREGDRVPLHIEVLNAGDAPLPSLPVVLAVDYETYAEWKTPADLAPGDTATWTLTWHATRGIFPFHAVVDPLNELVESDESNNTTFITIGAEQAPEPSPWVAVLAGILSFALAVGAAFLFTRAILIARRGAKRPSRFAPRPPSSTDHR